MWYNVCYMSGETELDSEKRLQINIRKCVAAYRPTYFQKHGMLRALSQWGDLQNGKHKMLIAPCAIKQFHEV